ncbi:MAG: tRNA (cytidine(34)-2'-O)-methyltransferase [Pirellulales bacterium]
MSRADSGKSEWASGGAVSDVDPWLHVVLHQPEIPPNTGNAGRTCVALGAKLWLVRPLGFRTDEHALRRAGMDYWQHLNWEVIDSWAELTERLAGHRFWLLTKSAPKSYTQVAFQRGDVLVFGSESQGLPESLRSEYADWCLSIPMLPPARCLNLACSVGVVTYEARRQLSDCGAGVPPALGPQLS